MHDDDEQLYSKMAIINVLVCTCLKKGLVTFDGFPGLMGYANSYCYIIVCAQALSSYSHAYTTQT